MRRIDHWMSRRLRAWASGVAIACIAAAARAGAQAAPLASDPAAGCTVRETSRAPLLIGGTRELYVEPKVVLPSGPNILLAGRPNYLFSAGPATAERTVAQDSVFGAIVDSAGRGRLVPAPIDPALIESTRGIALPGGAWAVAFAELTRPWTPPKPDTVARLWYGEYDGTRWRVLEQLPGIPGGTFSLDTGSELVPRGDTLFLAVPVRIESGDYAEIAVFQRHRGQWKYEIVHTIGGMYGELLYSDSMGLLLAVIQADRSLPRDVNSLLLYGRRPKWEILRKLVHGGSQPVYDAFFTRSAAGTVLSWWVMDRTGQPPARRARAMIGMTPDRDGRIVEIDPDVTHVTPVFGHERFPIWVTEHNTPTADRELRFLADSAGTGRVLASMSSPFTGPFAAAAVGASDILVSGPLFHADPTHPRLVSLLIRGRVECRTSAP